VVAAEYVNTSCAGSPSYTTSKVYIFAHIGSNSTIYVYLSLVDDQTQHDNWLFFSPTFSGFNCSTGKTGLTNTNTGCGVGDIRFVGYGGTADVTTA
jgi:hypothetical protein